MRLVVLVALLCAACGEISSTDPTRDAISADAGTADAATEVATDRGPPTCPRPGRECYDSSGFQRLSNVSGWLCDQWMSGDGGVPIGCTYLDGAGRRVVTVETCEECM